MLIQHPLTRSRLSSLCCLISFRHCALPFIRHLHPCFRTTEADPEEQHQKVRNEIPSTTHKCTHPIPIHSISTNFIPLASMIITTSVLALFRQWRYPLFLPSNLNHLNCWWAAFTIPNFPLTRIADRRSKVVDATTLIPHIMHFEFPFQRYQLQLKNFYVDWETIASQASVWSTNVADAFMSGANTYICMLLTPERTFSE